MTILANIPKRSLNLLTNSPGELWTRDGFQASWQAELSKRIFAPLRRHRRVFHGLRKSAVCAFLEAGCPDGEVAAITGQSKEILEHYAQQVNQRKLACAAILKWGQTKTRTRNEQTCQLSNKIVIPD